MTEDELDIQRAEDEGLPPLRAAVSDNLKAAFERDLVQKLVGERLPDVTPERAAQIIGAGEWIEGHKGGLRFVCRRHLPTDLVELYWTLVEPRCECCGQTVPWAPLASETT